MYLLDRIKNYQTYRYYMNYLKDLRSRGINVKFASSEFFLLPSIFNDYVHFVTLPKLIQEQEMSESDLDEFVISNFSHFFDDDKKKIFLAGLKSKNIILDYETCTTCIDDHGFYMLMNQYKYLSDVANFMHEILHVFVYNTKNPHINSEVISILFELIARDIINSLSKRDDYLITHINTLLDSMLANIRLIEVFPKITPVILPYIKAEYLSYELFLLYKNDPDRFIYHLKKILNSEMTIEQYLRNNNIVMREENFANIQRNHKKILTKQ